MSRGLVLVPGAIAELLIGSDEPWGHITVTTDPVDAVHVVTGYSHQEGTRHPAQSEFLQQHYTRYCDQGGWRGVWYRASPDLRDLWALLAARGAATDSSVLAEHVQGWRAPPHGQPMIVLTVAEVDGQPDIDAWAVSSSSAQPISSATVPETTDVMPSLAPSWPVNELTGSLVTVVGVGSIGSAAAEALAFYAVGRLALVDPDRLLPHNLVRHRADRRSIGKYKVNAVAELLTERLPAIDVQPEHLDVVEDADLMRPLFRRTDVVVCCVDGVEARQVTDHLARWAGVPIVLACVLDDGAIGEILRLRPGRRVGCLRCQRNHLRTNGQMDPEPGIDLEYGTGTRHRPMTAVGADLAMIGHLAAKAAVATLLEGHGYPDQRLPGDHGIIALRPAADLAAPFDLDRAGQIRWHPPGPPLDGCPTCWVA